MIQKSSCTALMAVGTPQIPAALWTDSWRGGIGTPWRAHHLNLICQPTSTPAPATHISLADHIFVSVLSEPTQIHPQQKIAASLHRAILSAASVFRSLFTAFAGFGQSQIEPQSVESHFLGSHIALLNTQRGLQSLSLQPVKAEGGWCCFPSYLLGVLVTVSVVKDSKPNRSAELAQSVCKLCTRCPARDTERRENSHFWIHLLTSTRNLHFLGFSQGSTACKSPRGSGLEVSTCSSPLS